jgi:hypothetical protein
MPEGEARRTLSFMTGWIWVRLNIRRAAGWSNISSSSTSIQKSAWLTTLRSVQLVGNWTIALSVNFGFASLIAGTVTMYHPEWYATAWELLLIFYAICIAVFAVVAFGNRILPYIDTVAAGWNVLCILVVFLGLSISADVGRHSAAEALAQYNTSLSGWGDWGFAIGLLPACYTYAAFGES